MLCRGRDINAPASAVESSRRDTVMRGERRMQQRRAWRSGNQQSYTQPLGLTCRLTLLAEMIRFSVTDPCWPPSRLEAFSLVVREVDLLLRFDDFDP